MSNAIASLHFHMDCSLDGAKGVHQHEKAAVRVKENIREPECVALACLAQLVVAKCVLSVRRGKAVGKYPVDAVGRKGVAKGVHSLWFRRQEEIQR